MQHPLPERLLAIPHKRDVPFERLTLLGIGGVCRWLFEPGTEAEAQAFVATCAKQGLAYRVLGGGSNLLVLGDIAEPVLRLRFTGQALRSGRELTAPASHNHMALAEAAAEAGLSGLEWAGGIPGSLGGAIRMNAGAHGGEWVQVLARYRFLTPTGELVEKVPEPGEFSYRKSWLTAGYVVLSATASLAEADPVRVRALLAEYRAKRVVTQPKGKRSAGCIFKNPTGKSAGWLIEQAGLKGFRVGDAEVSSIHANFLLNHGHATPAQFQELMDTVRARVKEIHGIDLEAEVEIWKE
jgi:UDP-N-acetylmuramate dehydrogenase